MNHYIKLISLFLLLFFANIAIAQDSDNVATYPKDFETSTFEDEVYDPLETVNRAIFTFNNVLDKIILEPVAKGYRILPKPVQSGIGNFFSNI